MEDTEAVFEGATVSVFDVIGVLDESDLELSPKAERDERPSTVVVLERLLCVEVSELVSVGEGIAMGVEVLRSSEVEGRAD